MLMLTNLSTFNRKPVDNSVQTEPLKFVDTSVQVVTSSKVEVQTDMSLLRDGMTIEEIKPPYPPSLYAFFAKVTGPMCEALEENLNPLYNLNIKMAANDSNEVESNETENPTELYELRSTSISEEYHCSCVSWNCNGTQVAVGYQLCMKDGNWCSHSSVISLWSLGRLQNQLNKNMEPHKELEVSGCVTACEFHPTNPSLLAVGLATGEIVLVDFYASAVSTNNSTNERRKGEGFDEDGASGSMYTNPDEISHTVYSLLHASPVESVKWTGQVSPSDVKLVQKSATSHLLLTCGKDGQIGLWSLNKNGNKLFLEKRFIILPRNLPDSIKYKPRLGVSLKELGITCLAANKLEPLSFLVGTFGCFIFECQLNAQDELDPTAELDMLEKTSTETIELLNGEPNFLRQMNSYVKAIDCSPFHQNLFLTLTIYGHATLQHTLKSESSVLELFMEEDAGVDIKWSGQPMQFGVAWNQTLSVFNIAKNINEPVVNILHKEALTAIAFNKIQ